MNNKTEIERLADIEREGIQRTDVEPCRGIDVAFFLELEIGCHPERNFGWKWWSERSIRSLI